MNTFPAIGCQIILLQVFSAQLETCFIVYRKELGALRLSTIIWPPLGYCVRVRSFLTPSTTWNRWGLRRHAALFCSPTHTLHQPWYHDARIYDKTSDTHTFANISHKSAQSIYIHFTILHESLFCARAVLFILIQQEPCKPSPKELLASKSLINGLKWENSFVKTAVFLTNEKHSVKLTDWNLVERGELVRTQKQQFPAQKLRASSLVTRIPAQFHPSAPLSKLPAPASFQNSHIVKCVGFAAFFISYFTPHVHKISPALARE